MAKKKTASTNEPSLDETLGELETLVEAMESGELTLDQAMAEFERGIKLTQHCQKALAEAEQKVEVLMKKSDGSDELAPFDAD